MGPSVGRGGPSKGFGVSVDTGKMIKTIVFVLKIVSESSIQRVFAKGLTPFNPPFNIFVVNFFFKENYDTC